MNHTRHSKHRKLRKWWMRNESHSGPIRVKRPGRSRYRRCPLCKKRRKWWMRANEWHEDRTRWGYVNGVKACWLCVKRAQENGDVTGQD